MKKHFRLGVLPAMLMYSLSALAATPVELDHQGIQFLTTLSSPSAKAPANQSAAIKEVSRSTDFNHTMHVRIKQTYQDYPVWGGDGVVHIPEAKQRAKLALSAAVTPASTMNGVVYQNLANDLSNTPAYVFNQSQAQKAVQQAISAYQQKTGSKSPVSREKSDLMVFVDKNNKAHWVFHVSFDVPAKESSMLPERPTYLIDAVTFQVYEQWNDIKTIDALAGGFGGNKKMGKLIYDGVMPHLSTLNIQRDAASNTCYLRNADVTVEDKSHNNQVMRFTCSATDPQHNNVYWDADFDAVNEAFSPANDALYAGAVIKDMYQKWYNLPVLVRDGKPMMLTMVVHERGLENAYWDGEKMTFGDGGSTFYPLTSLGVGAHEISHGFTEQHANLVYAGQSGGMNEAFSDMAAQAAEYYAYHDQPGWKNNWQIGPEIFKGQGEALRYMDQPSKDCHGWPAGWNCSIDSADQYGWGFIDVHHSSGVYNRFFYLLSTSEGWTTRKAFDVMVQANMHYWTPTATFQSAACGVIKAAKDYKYDTNAVLESFKKVKIDTSKC